MSVPLFFDISFLAILLVFICIGVYRGFIKSFVRSARLVLSALAAYAFGGMVGDVIKSLFLGTWVYDGVHGMMAGMIGNGADGLNAEKLLSAFPKFLIGDSSQARVEHALSEYSGEHLGSSVASAVSEPIASRLAGILGYALVFFLCLFLLRLVAWLFTEWADRISILGFFNRLLGGVWGALVGALALLSVSAVVLIFFTDSEVYTETVVVRWFCDSPLLNFLKS